MAQDFFIATLAVLTVVCGGLLLTMLRQRRRLGKKPAKLQASLDDLASTPPKTRPIDDYALPVSLDADAAGEEERDVGKICPACGSRYGSHFRYCERDNAELAALN